MAYSIGFTASSTLTSDEEMAMGIGGVPGDGPARIVVKPCLPADEAGRRAAAHAANLEAAGNHDEELFPGVV